MSFESNQVFLRKVKSGYLLAFLVALITIGCKDISYVMPIEHRPADVYMAGAKKNGADTAWSATYWKNGVPVSLTTGLINSSLFSISVTDSGIYAAGYEGITLKYWRNGIGIPLGDSLRAKAMSVVDADVYIAGWSKSNTAVYWKNGVQNIVSPHSAAVAIAISGNDVYLGGYQGSIDLTTEAVWKNGVLLSDPQGSGEINSIIVSGMDLYAAGSYLALGSQNQRACYWKNSTLVLLNEASHVGSANSIFVYGNDVYVAGYETNANGFRVAKYWKNGIATSLSDGTRSQEAHAIAVVHGDVYVTCDGPIPNSSILMKNGLLVAPFDGTSNKYYAFGLLVK